MKLGLVMEGGAMRGLFTAGVIDVFMERNILFDGAVGTSAGATFGCNIKSKQIGRPLRYNCNYCNDPRYGTIRSWIKTGDFFDKEFCYNELPYKLDIFDADAFRDNPMEFYVTATDVETGKAVYHKCYDGLIDDIEWIRASASVPIVSNIVKIDEYKLLDGGIADSVPLEFLETKGYEKNVVVLTQPDDYKKKPNKLLPLCKLIYKRYPKFINAFATRHDRYNANIDYVRKQENEGKAFVICPECKLPVKNAEKNIDNLKKAYDMGRKAAIEAIENRHLLEWISR